MAPQTLLLMRHAEKPNDVADPDLSKPGQKRAQRLATYIPETFGKVDILIAAAPSKHSRRPIETLTPLSKTIDVKIHATIADQDYAFLADRLLTKQKYRSKVVLVCWHHGYLPDLAEHLGARNKTTARRWDPSVFNVIWRLDYAKGSAAPRFGVIREPF